MRIRLRNDAGKLGRGFHQERSREERSAGEMAFQERFVTANEILGVTALPGIQRQQPVDKPELGAVREMLKSFFEHAAE